MGNTPDYYQLLSQLELPNPKESSRPLLPLTMKAMGAHSKGFKAALDWLTAQAVGKRNATDAAPVRDAMRLILMNLVDAMFARCWVAIPGKQESYNPGGYLSDKLHLTARSVGACMKALTEVQPNPLVYKKTGYADFLEGRNQCNKYFPTPDLQHMIWDAYVAVEEPIEPPYVFFKNPDAAWEPNGYDIDRLTVINEFLKGHSWAGKGPVRLKYSENPFRGGRLYTRFSQLPMRRIPLRINTLIDGKPICEVDYVSNHPRMALVLAGYEPPGDIYTFIASLLPKPPTRDKVKSFFSRSLGAKSKESAFNACKSEGINQVLFDDLLKATLDHYPNLKNWLFNDAGARLQSLEGQIGIEIMEMGMKAGIPVLPVHDSFTVPFEHEKWLRETMEKAWTKTVTDQAGPRVIPPLSTTYPTCMT
jgi:hypothetical protein